MPDSSPYSLPIAEAYRFAIEHGLSAKITAIQQMPIDPQKFKNPATVRHGYLQKLFEDHGLLEEFMEKHWPYGRTPEGQSKREVYQKT